MISQSIDLVQNVLDLVNKVPTTVLASDVLIGQWKSDLITRRQALDAKLLSLATVENSLESAKTAVVVAENNIERAEGTTLSSDVIVAQSSVSGALAGLNAARDALSKTQITAPIFGTISELELRVGDLVGPTSPVFVIANNDALRIDTFLSADEASQISIGAAAEIDALHQARVSNIAPALDRESGKVKVELLLTNPDIRLIEGVGVGIEIDRQELNAGILVPIDAVFVRGEKAFVYVLGEGRVIPREIAAPNLFGAQVVVKDGLEPDDQVVLQVRGLQDEEEVLVNTAEGTVR